MRILNNRAVFVLCILVFSAIGLVACGGGETIIMEVTREVDVEREVEVTRETIVEREVEVTRETILERQVEVEVTRERAVVQEVPVEVTRVVEQVVEVPVASSASMDYSLSPAYGSDDLDVGFTPDPYVVEITSGGQVDVNGDVGSGCYGYAAEAPDFTLYWDGWGELGFLFYAYDGSDTTLIINDPSGDWLCSDDYDGLNPGVVLSDADSGTYDIWIGSYSYGEYVSGELLITEVP